MNVYLVRRRDDHGILGVFWGDKYDLWACVYEVGDPDLFEATRLDQCGGIYADGPDEPEWPQLPDDDDDPDNESDPPADEVEDRDFAGFMPNETLMGVLFRQADARWRPLISYQEYHRWRCRQTMATTHRTA